jgi:plasmid maintenance system antidote protein VapI
MNTAQLRTALKGLNHSAVAKTSGVHRNLIARFVAGGDIKVSTADKLKAAVDEKKPGQQ